MASRTTQVSNLLNRFTKLKMNEQDPSYYWGDITELIGILEDLKPTTDEIAAHFILKGMLPLFKGHLRNITGANFPDLPAIRTNFQLAIERYEEEVGGVEGRGSKGSRSEEKTRYGASNGSRNTSVNAVNIEAKTRPSSRKPVCSLCDKENHWAKDCSKYKTPKAKVDRLNEIGGCINCVSKFHTAKKCPHKHLRCHNCKECHYEYLCLGKKGEKKGQHNTDSSVYNSLAYTDCMSGNSETATVLGTLTLKLEDGSSIRVLSDSGSQSNFISKASLTRDNHKVIRENIELSLNGINGRKSYTTDEVELIVKFGEESKPVRFYVKESIAIKLTLPRLGLVVKTFKKKGYQLADGALHNKSNSIKNLDAILGAGERIHLKENIVRFGKSSGYIDTTCGVVLQGQLHRLISDLPFLGEEVMVNHPPTSDMGLESCTLATDVSEQHQARSDKEVDTDMEYQEKDILPLHLIDEGETWRDDLKVDSDGALLDFLLTETTRTPTGRLCMPLLYNSKVKHMLARNDRLAQAVLSSTRKKYAREPDKLKMMDETIKDLESRGVIEKVDNVQTLLEEDPTCSFLGHKPIFKMERTTTKCRMVFLSNLCEKIRGKQALSHNEVMESGPCLNFKLSSALIQARFGKNLLCFDLKKAFCQIQLPKSDQNKLLFYWFRNIDKEDYTKQAYRNVRLSFGLRCSPVILMTGLWIILVRDAPKMYPHLVERCREIYTKIYMDNGATAADSSEEINATYDQLKETLVTNFVRSNFGE